MKILHQLINAHRPAELTKFPRNEFNIQNVPEKCSTWIKQLNILVLVSFGSRYCTVATVIALGSGRGLCVHTI